MGLSLLAGLLFINTASGLYRPARGRSLGRAHHPRDAGTCACAAAVVRRIRHLASRGRNREEVRWLTMLVRRRRRRPSGLCGTWRRATKPHSRDLDLRRRRLGPARRPIDHAGQSAGQDRRVHPGPERDRRASSMRVEVLSGPGSLKDRAIALGVDEIVVALSDRRGGEHAAARACSTARSSASRSRTCRPTSRRCSARSGSTSSTPAG